MELMVDMLDQLTQTITRMNRYITLLPKNAALRQYFLLMHDEYMRFCISAILFYERFSWRKRVSGFPYMVFAHKRIVTFFKFGLSTLQEEFRESKSRIEQHIDMFEKEYRADIDTMTVQGIGEIREIRNQLSYREQSSPTIIEKPHFRVAFAQNDSFVGRLEELHLLHSMLNPNQSPQRRRACTIHSMGGMGKTQLALQYAHKYRSEFDSVFWLCAERGPQLAQNFAEIARVVGATSQHSLASAAQAKEWLETTCTCTETNPN